CAVRGRTTERIDPALDCGPPRPRTAALSVGRGVRPGAKRSGPPGCRRGGAAPIRQASAKVRAMGACLPGVAFAGGGLCCQRAAFGILGGRVMSIHVPVDPTNPGQFFACCGLLELADRLWPGSEGWFSNEQFCVECCGNLAALVESVSKADLTLKGPVN